MQKILKRIEKGTFKDGAYVDCGTGFPIILVHGFPADYSLWNYQMNILCEEYRLILPDLPGTGSSPLQKSLSIVDMADFLKDILTQEKIEKCILIGHSMGGYATLAFAEKYPNFLSGWGLFHSSAYPDDAEKKEGRKRSIFMMEKYGTERFLKQMLPNLFSKNSRKHKKDIVKALIQKRTEAGITALPSYYRAMWERPDRTQALKDTKVPVLFIIGKEDTAAPMKDVLQQVSLPATSQINIFEDVAHLGMLEKSKATTQALRQFIIFCLKTASK